MNLTFLLFFVGKYLLTFKKIEMIRKFRVKKQREYPEIFKGWFDFSGECQILFQTNFNLKVVPDSLGPLSI